MNSSHEKKADLQMSTSQTETVLTLQPGEVYSLPCINAPDKKKSAYLIVKRLADFSLSFFGLILLSPLFLIVAIAIKLDSEGPVFYSQTRVGKNGKHFIMYKFRSMVVGADDRLKDLQSLNERDGPVFKIHDDPRVTRVGKFIRKTCIDELPQLINILRGEMSIVGPRPPLPNEVAEYTCYHMKRLSVTPGLTCFWQISDRDKMSFEEWVESDIRYINNRNVWTDTLLVTQTIALVIRQLFGK